MMASARLARGPLGADDWTDDRTVVAFQWEGSANPIQKSTATSMTTPVRAL
jgi:hypothetical protein